MLTYKQQRRSALGKQAYRPTDDENEADSGADAPQAESLENDIDYAALFRIAVGRACDIVSRKTELPPSNERLRQDAAILVILTTFLVRIELKALAFEDPALTEYIRLARQRVWSQVWSLYGWQTGHPRSWMMQCWADGDSRVVLREALSSASYATEAVAAACICSCCDGLTGGIQPELWLPLALVFDMPTDEVSANVTDTISLSLEYAARLSGDVYNVGDFIAALRPASLADTDGARALQPLQPLRMHMAGELSFHEAVARLSADLSTLARKTGPRGFALATGDTSGVTCMRCHTMVPSRQVHLLVSGRRLDIACESCGRLLIIAPQRSPFLEELLHVSSLLISLRHAGEPPTEQ